MDNNGGIAIDNNANAAAVAGANAVVAGVPVAADANAAAGALATDVNTVATATVDEFIDAIINEKGYQNLDEDVRQAMKQDMTQRLMDQIDHAAIDALSEDKAVELADKLEANPDMPEEEITKFMEDAGVDLNAIAMTTMLQFRMLYLGGSEK